MAEIYLAICDGCLEETDCREVVVKGGYMPMVFHACARCSDDSAVTNASERAYGRSMSDYYGGASPISGEERYITAWHEKQRLG